MSECIIVNEEDDVARAALDLVENAFDAAFELAAILGSATSGPSESASTALAAQRRGTSLLTIPLREAFDDGRLADAGFADEARDCSCSPPPRIETTRSICRRVR